MRRLLSGLLVAAVASSCAQPAVAPNRSAAPRVEVDLTDTGSSVDLRAGDRLIVNLGAAPGAEQRWALAAWPEQLLSPASTTKGPGPWRFRAEASGRGRIVALAAKSSPPCVPPRMAADECLRRTQPAGGAHDSAPYPIKPGVFVLQIVVR